MAQDALPPYLNEASNSPRKSESAGKKPYVFCAKKPDDLPDVHADLMEKALNRDEGLLYLLYTPICQERNGPFGLQATPASHSVAVTRHRFVISKDRRIKAIAPSLQSIPFNQVVSVELGNALFFGWLSIRFAVDEKASCTTLFFPSATGMRHFGLAVSEYRRMTRPTHGLMPSKIIEWADVWRHTPKTEVDHLKLLIIKEEIPFNWLRSSERWVLRKSRGKSVPSYVSQNGILISTNIGFIHATEEPCTRPEIFSFGVNASCIAFDGLKSAQVLEKSLNGTRFCFLQLKIARGDVTIDFDIPFDGSSLTDAENLARFFAQEVVSK